MAATSLARPAPVPTLSAPAAAPDLGPVAAVAGLVLAFLVVFVWRIGGVVLVLAEGRGVHSGDLLALPLALPALGQLLRRMSPAPAEVPR